MDGGFILPMEAEAKLNDKIKTGDEVELNFTDYTLKKITDNQVFQLKHPGDVLPIIEAGGVFDYARKTGMITS